MFNGFKSNYVKVKKGKVFCRVGGEGPPLLLLHGYPQTHLMWHKTAPELSKRFTVIAADLRGKNASAYDFPKKCVLVLGSEAHGISKQTLDYIEDFIFINKLGSGNSLNVSTAGSILIYLLMNKLK